MNAHAAVPRRPKTAVAVALVALVSAAIVTSRGGVDVRTAPRSERSERQHEVGFITKNEESGQEADRTSGGWATEDFSV